MDEGRPAIPMSLSIGATVVYLTREMCFPHAWGGIEGTEVSRELAVGRIFHVVSLPQPTDQIPGRYRVRPVEGGAITECYSGFLLTLEEVPSYPIPSALVQLREIDILDLPPFRGVGLYLSDSHWAKQYPGNAESLRLRGIATNKVYRIRDVPAAGKAIRLVGVEGVFYMGLFKCVNEPDMAQDRIR